MLGEGTDERPARDVDDHAYFVLLLLDDVDAFFRDHSARRDRLVTACRQAVGAARLWVHNA
jgi:hypothetical protein